MGKKAFKILYKEIKDKKNKKIVSYKDVVLNTDLIIRESTQKIG
jgi:LacI family transcriptional regulator